MREFTIVSSALDKDITALYIDEAINLAQQLAIITRKEFKIFSNHPDKPDLIVLIRGDEIRDHHVSTNWGPGKPDKD